ncbi:hypothetical protein [Microbulbifer epialgicus]|uniref:DUF2147 domain-containing protein n=1 Tax=Microbulbifer epialgicus TaxID=393907 RepID=A0ABV4P3V0_9GAMM
MKSFAVFFVIISFFYVDASFASMPQKYIGTWKVTLKDQSGFPWWNQIKYPVKISISYDQAKMIDQFGYECSITKSLYDSELDVFVFSHCGIGRKSDRAFEVFQMATVDSEGRLQGEVRSYKTIFKWVGVRVKD